MILRLLMVVVALLAATPLAARQSAPAAPVAASGEHERLRADMEGQVERLGQDFDRFMAVQDQRISQLSYFGNFNNGLIALLAVVIAVVAAVLGFKFPKMATRESKRHLDEWLETEGKAYLDQQFAGFRERMAQDVDVRITQALAEFDQKADPHLKRVMETAELAERLESSRKAAADSPAGTPLSEILKDPERLRAAAAAATAKPEEQCTFADWYVLAWHAWDRRENGAAAARFLRAAACGHSDPMQLARAYLNASDAWEDDGRFEQALGALDELETHVPAVPEQAGELASLLSEAGFQRGWCLTKLERFDDALAAYERHIQRLSRFADQDDVRRHLAGSRLNRGVLLSKNGKNDAALTEYEELIALYDNADNAELRMTVVKAKLNRARRLAALHRREEAEKALRLFLVEAGDPPPAELIPYVEKARERLAKLTGGSDGSRP